MRGGILRLGRKNPCYTLAMHATVLSDKGKLKGSYIFKVTDSKTGELKRTVGPVKNLIVNSTGRGYDLLARHLGGDTTYEIAVDSAKIGTGNAAVTEADTDLQTAVLSGIGVADVDFPTAGKVLISFFMTDASLANGTYREFGIFANGRLVARSIITPDLVKGSNENITAEYTLDFT